MPVQFARDLFNCSGQRKLASCVTIVCALGLMSSRAALSQPSCLPVWQNAAGNAGTNGAVQKSVRWDPDGAGPSEPYLVLGGAFNAASNIASTAIVAYQPTSNRWFDLNLDLPAFSIMDFAVSPGGDLYVAAVFLPSSPDPLQGRVFRWDGTAWIQLGGDFDSYVRDITVRPNGELVAVGDFTNSGLVQHNGVARWNGVNWGAIDGAPRRASKIVARPDGSLFIYGLFTSPQGSERLAIGSWNGNIWTEVATAPALIETLVAAPNGDVLAGGTFQSINGAPANGIARWSNGVWSALGGGINGTVRSIEPLEDGRLLAAGQFVSAGTVTLRNLAFWDGSAWSDPAPSSGPSWSGLTVNNFPLQATLYTVSATSKQSIFVGGAFDRYDSTASNNIAFWNGEDWQALAQGTNAKVAGFTRLQDGSLLASGDFTTIEGVLSPSLARWDGTRWSMATAPLSGPATAAAQLPSGDLFVSGSFQLSAGVPLVRLVRWNGSSWSAFAQQVSSAPTHLAALPNGDVFGGAAWPRNPPSTGSVRRLIRWNGTSWSSSSDTIEYTTLAALLVLPSGDLLAAGEFTLSPSGSNAGVLRWNGSSWAAVDATSIRRGSALALLHTGEVLAAGFTEDQSFRPTSILYTLDAQSQTWRPLTAPVNAVINHVTPTSNGALFATGGYTRVNNEPPFVFTGHWNGQSWRTLPDTLNSPATALSVLSDGTVLLGGDFTMAAGQPSAYLARLSLQIECTCDSIDFNNDLLFPSDFDLIDYLSVLANGPCSTNTCNDIDFNNDGLFPSDDDIVAFLRVLAGGAC